MIKNWMYLTSVLALVGVAMVIPTRSNLEKNILTPDVLRNLPICSVDNRDGDLGDDYRLLMEELDLPDENPVSKRNYEDFVFQKNGEYFSKKELLLPC